MAILIFSPFANIGHFSTYNVLYAKTLLNLGHRVILLTPLDDSASKILSQEFEDDLNKRLFIFEFSHNHLFIAHFRLYQVVSNYKKERLTFPRVSTARVNFEKVKDFLFRKKYKCPNHLRLHFPFYIGPHIENILNIRIEHILFMYLDMLSIDSRDKQFCDENRINWSGLLFGPRLVRDGKNEIEPYLTHPSCKSILVLDDSFQKPYAKTVVQNLPFTVVWDLINAKTSNEMFPLKEKIIQKANGRKIIFVGGCIGGKKYLREYIDCAKLAENENKYFFVIIGQILAHTFSEEDQAVIKGAREKTPENMYIYDKFVDSEEEFNALINISNVIYVAHKDFPFSSNILIKAAYYNKPSIGLNEGFIGRSIEEYSLGHTLETVSAENILKAIGLALVEGLNVENTTPFLERHSNANLDKSLQQWSKHM